MPFVLRRALAAAAIVLGLWLLAQAAVLSQQAASAHAQARQRVPALLQWSLAEPQSIVGPGSEGIASASAWAGGLRVHDDVLLLDLSLALRGRVLPLDVVQRARLLAHTDQPLEVTLLAGKDEATPASVIGHARLLPPGGTLTLPLHAPFDRARVLRLRVQRAAPGNLDLRWLRLVAASADGCRSGWCDGTPERLQLPAAATPERFLSIRDQLLAARPLAIAAVAGAPAWLGAAAERAAMQLASAAGWLSLPVLGWALWRRCRSRQHPREGRARELLPLLAIPLLLLALPAPDSSGVPLAFSVCCLAALVHPGGRADWRWLGDAAAWRSAGLVTAAGAALAVLLLSIDAFDGNDRSAAAWSWERAARYLPWALLQQALLLVAIAPRMARSGRDPLTAALLAGAVFALLHLPNFGLMLGTFAAGSAWARSGSRHGALLPLALSHWLLGTLVVLSAPDWLLRSAEIGGRFLMPGG